MRFRRSMEVLVEPSQASAAPVWVDAESTQIRIAGHEVYIRSTKDGLEITYEAPKNKKAKRVSAETSADGARLKVEL